MKQTKVLNIKCPLCEKAFNYYDSDFRPFCSERCRLIDLGAWLNESYAVPEKPTEGINEEPEEE
jgi:endogenous inhibitor of DNA gyrase (YacG/DUF329 family)